MKKYLYIINVLIVAAFLLPSCKEEAAADESAATAEDIITPVTVTNPVTANMSETIELNAVSAYLLKTFIKANTNGYLQVVNAQLGRPVSKGQLLFVIKTKEAEALGNTINILDSSLNFEGIVKIKSPGNGFVAQINYTAGDYVQDGEQLATITDTRSFVFLLDLPYELKQYLAGNNLLQLKLPDGTTLSGQVQSALPMLDSVAQTQRYIIKVNTNQSIPENLLAKVNLVKSLKPNTTALPKAAVLSDEEQTTFWIMKMINDSMAVKVDVEKGIETKDSVEIVSPKLLPQDKILLSGNYGLADTAKVQIVKE